MRTCGRIQEEKPTKFRFGDNFLQEMTFTAKPGGEKPHPGTSRKENASSRGQSISQGVSGFLGTGSSLVKLERGQEGGPDGKCSCSGKRGPDFLGSCQLGREFVFSQGQFLTGRVT